MFPRQRIRTRAGCSCIAITQAVVAESSLARRVEGCQYPPAGVVGNDAPLTAGALSDCIGAAKLVDELVQEVSRQLQCINLLQKRLLKCQTARILLSLPWVWLCKYRRLIQPKCPIQRLSCNVANNSLQYVSLLDMQAMAYAMPGILARTSSYVPH